MKLFILFIFLLIGIVAMFYYQKTDQRISSQTAKEMMIEKEEFIILDVRTPEEFSNGHIRDAINLSHDKIQEEIKELIPDKNIPILIYCRSGNRSATAAREMNQMGYTQVYDFGGINDWDGEIIVPQ